MSKKFWQRDPVSKMLKKPRQALRKTLHAVRGRGGELELLSRDLPESLVAMERGTQVLNRGFPIREGQSTIDLLVLSPSGELTFVWVKGLCKGETLSKLLPDYDWIQKNRALWPHLFPQVLSGRSLPMRVWIFALEIDPEVQYLLNYLQGIRIQLFQAAIHPEKGTWKFKPWSELPKVQGRAPELPSSPSLLSVVPEPATVSASPPKAEPLLSREEINDLIALPGEEKPWSQEDEVTDPFYELRFDPESF